ncbi:ABC transporter permease [Alkalicoccobacillus plakortidis]|uniref:FtsX-like permease family protein n=1 Tax=Alkalicoccobacillus plakortidis TaxID=444060 RepID=A0ABT0XNN2_9BACI|nr:FtsX-like permease family protein [Alkalicoccobacillus plakortidis]MCM2676859.1 FtsX-like permease family protein [Alkalicoccobacillus plakortidis]
MNIVNRLTIRHLKENKRRTLVTILGTIISAAMIAAVATIGVSYTELLRKDAIEHNGDWHVSYEDITPEQIDLLKQDENTASLSLIQEYGFAELEEPPDDYRPYVWVRGMNDEAFEQFDVHVIEGRLPQSSEELVVSTSSEEAVNWSVGDTVSLDLGKRYTESEWAEPQDGILTKDHSIEWNEDGERTETLIETEETSYTIVGFFEQPKWEVGWNPGYLALSFIDSDDMDQSGSVDGFVYLNNLDRSLYDDANELAELLGITGVQYNDELLRYSGITASDNMDRTMYGLLGVIIAVIIVGSVALIFNAFAISVSERSRHLGMLSSVGATKQQKRNSVFFEGLIIGSISIPIGIVAGIVGIGITFIAINPMLDSIGLEQSLTVTVTPYSIAVAVLLSAVTIFISTWLPAQRASRITAMDAIRQTHDIKLKTKTVRTSKIVRKWFGVEAELGLKNLKRNKKRYHITVLSLIVSIVLFLSVSYFTEELKRSYQLAESGDSVSYDLEVSVQDEEMLRELEENMGSLTDVTAYQTQKLMQLSMYLEEDEVAPEFIDSENVTKTEDGRYIYYVNIKALDEQSLKTYTEQAGIKADWNENPLSAIVINTINYEDMDLGKYVQTKAILTDIGEPLAIVEENWDTNEVVELPPLMISALTSEVPMGSSYQFLGGLDVVVSEETFEEIRSEADNPYLDNIVYITSDDPYSTEKEIDEFDFIEKYSIYNQNDSRVRGEQMVAVLSVFTYGFVTLITLISLANILNTISTGVALRKREFAMLRSVGMTQRSFRKMMIFESAFYGIKSLIYGVPISIAVMYVIYLQTQYAFSYTFALPWQHIIGVIIAVFGFVSLAMLYSLAKTKNETIIEGLTQENQ